MAGWSRCDGYLSLKIRWPEPIARAYAATANCKRVSFSTEWRHGRSISTIRQWPEVLQRSSRHRASQHGGHWARSAKDAGRHGRPGPAPGRDGGGRAPPLVRRSAFPADLAVQPSSGGHRTDHDAQDHDAGKPGEFEHPVRTGGPQQRRRRQYPALSDVRGPGRVQGRVGAGNPRGASAGAGGDHGSARLSGVNGPPPPAASAVPSLWRVAGALLLALSAWFGGSASAADPLGR